MDIQVDERTVIVFDLDDTLYNEMAYLKSAYAEIAQKMDAENWRTLYARMYSLFRSKKDVFEFLTSNYETDKPKLLNIYRSHRPKLELFDGVRATMEAIKAKQGKIGIITDGRSSTQRVKLQALKIMELLDIIVISEEIGSEKPDKANYRKIEQAFPGSHYLYMADNLRKDFITPNKLGWKTVGLIDNGLNMHFDGHQHFDEALRPKYFVMDFEEINIV